MKPDLYQIIARIIFPLEYRRTLRFVRDNIAHAVRSPMSRTAELVAEASELLRHQYGK